jgi:hypothetical protein
VKRRLGEPQNRSGELGKSNILAFALTLLDVTGLADNIVERRVFVYLCDSALFPRVF